MENVMLVRPFSDIHIEFWPANNVARILGMVVPALPTDKETVAVIAGDLGFGPAYPIINVLLYCVILGTLLFKRFRNEDVV
jgi:hypothetical protein